MVRKKKGKGSGSSSDKWRRRQELVDCPRCERGRRAQQKSCPLCKGAGRILALRE